MRIGMRSIFDAIIFSSLILSTESLSTYSLDRRKVFSTLPITSVAILSPKNADAATKNIASRLEANVLSIPAPSYSSELNGIDNLYFPSWMAGEWQVKQTLRDFQTPLGLKFIGGPNGSMKIAQDTFMESQKKIGVPVSLKLRFLSTKWGVAEDRLYNSRQRLDSFAEKTVVANVEYANVGGSNRPSVLAMGGTEQDPLQTTVVRFKGPAAQKTFCVSHESESTDDSTWFGYELDRSIFALTNQNTAPPLTTDSELIWKLQRLTNDRVVANLRIAEYLNAQSDSLFFEARNRAVSILDYTLEMQRIDIKE